MRNEKLNRLLDSIYELEGLVHLAISRDDEPAMLPELIVRKSRELNLLAQQTVEMDFPLEEENNYEPQYGDKLISEIDDREDPESGIEEEEEEEEEDEENSSVQETLTDYEHEQEEDPTTATPAPDVASSEQKIIAQPAKKESYKFDEPVEPRGRLVFSINDRYRFKRELFKGSDVEFNTTLSLVASMDGYEEAEDYFLNELQWDDKSPDVIDFLEILKNYYK